MDRVAERGETHGEVKSPQPCSRPESQIDVANSRKGQNADSTDDELLETSPIIWKGNPPKRQREEANKNKDTSYKRQRSTSRGTGRKCSTSRKEISGTINIARPETRKQSKDCSIADIQVAI